MSGPNGMQEQNALTEIVEVEQDKSERALLSLSLSLSLERERERERESAEVDNSKAKTHWVINVSVGPRNNERSRMNTLVKNPPY